MTIKRLHHVQITIDPENVETARRFYCDILGLPEIAKPPSLVARGGLWVALADQQIHIGVETGVDRSATKAHIAYQVDDLDKWRVKLSNNGIIILESVPIPGYERFECRDPFGNRLEFIEVLT
jgi:catechol 2,3-dioxygenase-like lactoylglutathione lyase family enzyme